MKYIVVSYCKLTSVVNSFVCDTKEKAYKYICSNTLIDLKNNEYGFWLYKIIEVNIDEFR